MARKKIQDVISYSTLDVFAAAVVAHRINGGYYKSNGSFMPDNKDAQYNGLMVFDILKNPAKSDIFTDQDRAEAAKIIEYYQSKLLEVIAGNLSPFATAAVDVSNKETVHSNLDIGIIISLPEVYRRSVEADRIRQLIEVATQTSYHFLEVGAKFSGKVDIASCFYSEQWNTYYIKAITEQGNLVLFPYNDGIKHGTTIMITSSKVKALVNDGITKLNYVKITR